MQRFIKDSDVGDKSGIIPYLLAGKSRRAERFLSLRAFDDNAKLEAYEKQGGICPICGEHFEYDQMEGDHKIPWCDGGKTTISNLQMLCKSCNRQKSNY